MKNLISTLALVGLIACDSQITVTQVDVASSTPSAVETPVSAAAASTSDSTTLNTEASPTPAPTLSIQATPVASTSPSPTPSITSTASPTPSATPTATPIHFVYVLDNIDNQISEYGVSPVDSKLTLIGSIATGKAPTDIMFDVAKNNIYVLNSGDSNIIQYQIQTDGTLKKMGYPVSIPNASSVYTPKYLSMGIDNKLYVKVDQFNAGNQYTFSSQGALTFIDTFGSLSGYLNVFFGAGVHGFGNIAFPFGTTITYSAYLINYQTNVIEHTNNFASAVTSITRAGKYSIAMAVK